MTKWNMHNYKKKTQIHINMPNSGANVGQMMYGWYEHASTNGANVAMPNDRIPNPPEMLCYWYECCDG